MSTLEFIIFWYIQPLREDQFFSPIPWEIEFSIPHATWTSNITIFDSRRCRKRFPRDPHSRKTPSGPPGVPGSVLVTTGWPKESSRLPERGLQIPNETPEYWKVTPTQISNALKCENRGATSNFLDFKIEECWIETSIWRSSSPASNHLRRFRIEETLKDFNLKVIPSRRQPIKLSSNQPASRSLQPREPAAGAKP